MQKKNDSIKLLQITDTHLFAEAGGALVGMDCDEGLDDVLNLAREQDADAKAVLFTGDASQDGSSESYQRLSDKLTTLGLPQYWIPGNHDELLQMQGTLSVDNPCFQCTIAMGDWRIILLNSAVPGLVSGSLSEAELGFLKRTLQESREAHIMICLHHNPLPVAAAWLQRHALKNPEDLLSVLDADDRVRLVVFGHIHQDYQAERNGVQYYGSPSTCVQFHPSNDEFKLDELNPGYRWLSLNADGSVDSGVRRVENKRYDIDFSGIGY